MIVMSWELVSIDFPISSVRLFCVRLRFKCSRELSSLCTPRHSPQVRNRSDVLGEEIYLVSRCLHGFATSPSPSIEASPFTASQLREGPGASRQLAKPIRRNLNQLFLRQIRSQRCCSPIGRSESSIEVTFLSRFRFSLELYNSSKTSVDQQGS